MANNATILIAPTAIGSLSLSLSLCLSLSFSFPTTEQKCLSSDDSKLGYDHERLFLVDVDI
jgi:hypothetical protein